MLRNPLFMRLQRNGPKKACQKNKKLRPGIAGPALRPLRCAQGRLCGFSSGAGSCRAANKIIRILSGCAVQGTAPWKSRKAGERALRYISYCERRATLSALLGFCCDGKLEYMHLNPVRKGLLKRPEDCRWSSYNKFALDNATVAASPIPIDYVRLPLGYWHEKSPRAGRY